jgi:hypothetical protein
MRADNLGGIYLSDPWLEPPDEDRCEQCGYIPDYCECDEDDDDET